MPGCQDRGFEVWSNRGLTKIGDLFNGQILLSFQQLQQQYGLQKCEFFKYLQIRRFITKDTTLLFNCATSPIEKALSLQISKKRISVFYKTLSSHSPLTSRPTKHAWEGDLGISIDEVDWQEVWTRAMDISTCNRTRSIQFKIVHRTHITPVLKNKMDANASPLCWKCNSETGDYIHCLWSCVKLHLYWSDIVNELSAIFGVSILMDLMCLILGLPDAHITNTKHRRLFN